MAKPGSKPDASQCVYSTAQVMSDMGTNRKYKASYLPLNLLFIYRPIFERE